MMILNRQRIVQIEKSLITKAAAIDDLNPHFRLGLTQEMLKKHRALIVRKVYLKWPMN